MNQKYRLYDTFNNHVISQHRTATGAGKAARKFSAAVKRHNVGTSYIPLEFQERYPDGEYRLVIDEIAHNYYDEAKNSDYFDGDEHE